MAKRTIIKNELIPATGKVLGQTSIVHKLGGNTTTSFNSTDVFNFDVKDEGEIEEKDPQKSYLTTTFYPLLFTDRLNTSAKSIDRAILTDNLYATHGFSEEISTGASDVNIVYFKRALIVIDYYSNSYAKRDAFLTKASKIVLTLRDVLRTYSISNENITVSAKKVSFSIRSVLINYLYYKPENIKTAAKTVSMSTALYSNAFSSLLLGDSKNVGTVVNNDVTMIKDKGKLTWTFSDNMTVDKSARFEENALKMDKTSSYLNSNESLNLTSEDGVEIFFEDWIKPATLTSSLLTSYGNVATTKEKALIQDKIDNVMWTVEGSGFNGNNKNIILTNTRTIKKTVSPTDLVIENPITNSKGTTLELNCNVSGPDRIYLLSNLATTLSTTLKESFAIVWYGASTSNPALVNKIAIVGDDPALIDANSHMIVSTSDYPTGSDLNITVVFYNMYIKLFVNGELQGVKLINRTFNLGYNGAVRLGKVDWYAYTNAHTYTVKGFRLTKMALHLGNTFTVTDPYDLYAIPDIAKIGEPIKYPLGLTCGLRYIEDDNTTISFVAITDSNDITFETKSTPLDITKWNYVQMANTGSDITLYVNGIASGSLTLPYNIKFKDILVGSKETNGYQGKMDNFRIYSKIRDESRPLRSSELFFTQDGVENTNLLDSNGLLTWTKNIGSSFKTTTNTDYRGREFVGGISTANTGFLVNPYFFKTKLILNNATYKTNPEAVVIASESFNNTSSNYASSFNLAKDVFRLRFSVTNTATSSLLTIGSATLEINPVSAESYKLTLVIGSARNEIGYVFYTDTLYDLVVFKLGQQVVGYNNFKKIFEFTTQTVVAGTTIVAGPFTGSIDRLTTSDISLSKAVLIEAINPETSEGFLMNMYEPFQGIFTFDAYFENNARSISDAIVYGGEYNSVEVTFKSKHLTLTVNNIESDRVKTEYKEIGDTVKILPINATRLAYVQGITSAQDALLPVPYKVESTVNESIYTKAVLSLSTDSDYSTSAVFDRNSNTLAKDVINQGVSKGIIHPGFFFNGENNYLRVKSDDFSFDTEDFYIEYEVYLNSLAKRTVILDRYVSGKGSWQTSINTDGHLYFTITNSNTSPYYYFIDVPTGIVTQEWYKIQISRKGTTFKFYLDDVLVYEYDSGSVISFDKKGVDLHVGYQGTVVNNNYNLNGYVNNIRIVKGLALETETTEESRIVDKIKEQPTNPAIQTAIVQLVGDVEWEIENETDLLVYVLDGEELVLPLATLANKILLNSELGDEEAIAFVGERVLIPEQYNIYKTSSDTVLNIIAKDGALYDSKSNTWTNTQNIQIEDGRAPVNNQWLKFTTNTSTTTTAVFNNTTELLLEGSFALTEQLATPKELFYFGNLLRVSVSSNNTGLSILFNGVQYSISHLLRDEVWYKFALCYKEDSLYIYIDDFKYKLSYQQATWATTASSVFTVVNGTTKHEAVKLSTKCPYVLSKGRDNLYLSTHLSFEKNKVDNGNTPKAITLTSTTSSTEKPFYGLGSEAFSANSLLTITKGLNVTAKPFTIETTVKFNTEGVKEDILNFVSNGVVFNIYKDIDNKIKTSITAEEETTIYENVSLIKSNTWYKINFTRDLGNIFSIGVDNSINYFPNFRYEFVDTDLVFGGFVGNIYDIKIYTNYSVVSKVGTNILKVDFENGVLSPDYVTDVYNNKLLYNNNVSLVKGLSKTSEYVGYFDGVSSFLKTQKDPFLNLGKDKFEISFSIYPTSGINDYQTIIASAAPTFTGSSFFVMMYGANQPSHILTPASNRIALGIGPDVSTNPFLLCNTQLAYNVWTDVKITHEGNVYNVYLNDVLDKTVNVDVSFNLNDSGATLIGRNLWDGSKGYFQGYLDNIKIAREDFYKESTEIDATEGLISGLDFEDVGSGFDVVESELDGNTADTYSNAWVLGRYDATSDFPYYRTVSAINDAIYFKNKGFMYCYNKHFAMGLDPFTISIDFNQTKRSSADAHLVHVYGLYAIVITSAGHLEIDFAGVRTRVGLVNLDTFYTLAITRDTANNFRIFLDGKLVNTIANRNFNSNFGTGTLYPLCLGMRFDVRNNSGYVNNYFTGFLDNFIYDRNKCRYTQDYAVFIDKTEKIKNNSFVEFQNDGVTSFPDLAEPSLQWTASGITTTMTANKFTTFSGQNLLNGGYMNSTSHGWQLGRDDFSVDLIFKPRQTTAETCLLDLSLNTGITEGLRIVQHNTSTAAVTVEVGSTGSATWTTTLTTGLNTLQIGNVYHLRVTRNLGTIYLYLNGVLKDSKDFTGDINIGSTISLFNNRARTRGFTGTIEQFRFIRGSAVSALDSFTEIKESLK